MKQWLEKKSRAKGYLLTLPVVFLGIILWLIIWRLGYIAAIVSFLVAFGVFWMFKLGAGEATKRDWPWLSLIVFVTVLIAFFSGLLIEAWQQYSGFLGGQQGFFSADFWEFATPIVTDITHYSRDLLMAIGFTVLGVGSLLIDQYRQSSTK